MTTKSSPVRRNVRLNLDLEALALVERAANGRDNSAAIVYLTVIAPLVVVALERRQNSLLKWSCTLMDAELNQHQWDALLGHPTDGARFTLTWYPTCYRRGPYRLLVEVLPGEKHHDWGCFDDADQPMRNFHDCDNALDEAERIAQVLMADRLRRGPLTETTPLPSNN